MELGELLRYIGLKRTIYLLVALVGLLMMGCSPRLFLLGNLLVIIGTVLSLLSNKTRPKKYPTAPLRSKITIGLIPLGALAIAVMVSMQFPENSSLGFWGGALVVWGAIGVAFWFVLRRGKQRRASGEK